MPSQQQQQQPSSSSQSRSSSSNHNFQPLGDAIGQTPQPKVALPIPMGRVAEQTSQDMSKARNAASFDPAKIEEVLRDSRIDNATRIEMIDILAKDEWFGNWKKRAIHWNREQSMEMGHFAMRRILDIAEKNDWTSHQIIEATLSLDLQNPISIHWVAFVPVIMGQGSAEQMERWGNRAMNHEILGCYMQTELGHGSNVQALETTCTYDEANDCFDLHSPTMTSTKWWAGGLGTTSTHAVVQAQLIIKGKSYGPHLFFVALRSMEDHKLFPGIVAGDIGPKTYNGFPALDNGWARFDHYKVPRDNMLSKFAKVNKGGEYVKPPSDKLSYGSMLFIRSMMIDRTGWMLSRGATIALRYGTVRRQFRDPNSKNVTDIERNVLSYPSLNRRLIPYLAKSFAYILAGRRMKTLYEDLVASMEGEVDLTLLADTHVASSSLKAFCTKQALDGIEECRQSLGGHGFLASAGYSSLFPEQTPAVTYEGDNYILMQQVGRAALKTLGELKKDPQARTSNTSSFIKAIVTPGAVPFKPPTSASEWLRPETYTNALGLRAALLVSGLAADVAGGRVFGDLSYECIEVATSHAEVTVNAWFAEAVKDDAESFGPDCVKWLEKLVALNALTSVARNITPLALPSAKGRGLAGIKEGVSALTPESVLHLETAIRTLVEELLPQAIPLSDAFGWTDWELGSALGRKDGRVYEALMAEAEGNPLNHPSLGDDARSRGIYQYGGGKTGNNVIASYQTQIKPLLEAAAKRSDDGGIKGDGKDI